jgi:hypothetical protein
MIEKPDQRTSLLAEAFHENWNDGPIALYARQAAAHARQRRRWRHGLLAGATAGVVAALMMMSVHRIVPVRIAGPLKPAPAYEIISDEELLALLHDRPLLVVQKENGTRELVLLEH